LSIAILILLYSENVYGAEEMITNWNDQIIKNFNLALNM